MRVKVKSHNTTSNYIILIMKSTIVIRHFSETTDKAETEQTTIITVWTFNVVQVETPWETPRGV